MQIDLRELIILIKQYKDFESHLCLDLGCTIEGHDPKPLIRSINYIINYMKESGSGEIQIDLDSHNSKHQLVFIIYTKKIKIFYPSEKLRSVVESYQGIVEWVFEPGKYVKLQLIFNSIK